MSTQQFQKDPIWKPDEKSGCRMKHFMSFIENKYDLKFSNYWNFHKWSVQNIPEFWAEFWNYSGIVHSQPFEQVVDTTIPMEKSPKWFEGAKVNFAENLLKHRNNKIALIVTGEDRDTERVTYFQLYEEAKIYAAAFRKVGLKKGDRVACYMSNRKEALLAMLGVTSVGGIWTGALPTLGAKAALNRILQVSPKFLITVDQFSDDKEVFHLLENIKEISDGLPSLEKVIIVPSKPDSRLKDKKHIKNSCFLEEFLQLAQEDDGSIPDFIFEQMSVSDPVFINYTSGTTGLPKTLVHGFASLLPSIRELWFHWDSQENDVWLSMSPVGWVSWNMILSILFIGKTLVLFEGKPYFLSPTYFWDLVDELGITRMFVTPAVLDGMESKGYLPTEKHHLTSLDLILCGSSVVKPHNFEFVFNRIKKDIRFVVGFGCTELIGFLLATELTLPQYKGEISVPSLGVDIECLDSEGNPVKAGEMGDIVVSKPVPSTPLSLWGDTDGTVLKKAYFSKFPGKFAIGDSVIINPVTKGIIVLGRSDETLKQQGTRFGSSEIYNVVEVLPEVQDSLCVAQYGKERDERAVLFLHLRQGFTFDEDLKSKVRKSITKELTAKHVPLVILEAPGIPRNSNGKKMEIIVKKIINKVTVNTESVANAECIKFYYDVIANLEEF